MDLAALYIVAVRGSAFSRCKTWLVSHEASSVDSLCALNVDVMSELHFSLETSAVCSCMKIKLSCSFRPFFGSRHNGTLFRLLLSAAATERRKRDPH